MDSQTPNPPPIDAFATEPRRTLKQFLLESDIKLLVFVGKCMDYFGMGAVAGFLLGATSLYGYALFKELPYAGLFVLPKPAPQQFPTSPVPMPPKPEKIRIDGTVTRGGDKIVTDAFQVAVVEIVSAEFTQGDGKFYLEVPRQLTYKIAFWKPNYEDLQIVELPLGEGNTIKATWSPRYIAQRESMEPNTANLPRPRRDKKLRIANTIFDVEDLDNTLGVLREPQGILPIE